MSWRHKITPNWSLDFSMTRTSTKSSTSQTLFWEKHTGSRGVTSYCPQELCPCVWLMFFCALPVCKIPKHKFIHTSQELEPSGVKDLHNSETDALQALGFCHETVKASEGSHWNPEHSLPILYIPCSSKIMNLILVLASSPRDLSQSSCRRQCRCCLRAEHSWHKELENCRDNQERKGEKILDGSENWHTPVGNRKQRETDEESKYRLSDSFLSFLKSQGLFSLWFSQSWQAMRRARCPGCASGCQSISQGSGRPQ